MKVHFTLQARQDLDGIADYIRTHEPKASLRVRAAILDSIHIAEEIVILTIQHPARERTLADR